MFVIRLRFAKTDECAYISHLDLQRVMSRALRQSKLPVWFSAGFNPHIYMTFALPLSLSHNSVCDAVDFKSEQPPKKEWLSAINACLPFGIKAFSIYIATSKPSEISYARYELFADDDERFKNAASQYNDVETAMVTKKTKRKEIQINLKEYVPKLLPINGGTTIELPAGNLTISPSLLIDFLEQYGIKSGEITVVRTAILDKEGKEWL